MAKNINYDNLSTFKTEADKVYATKTDLSNIDLSSKQDALTTEQLANLNADHSKYLTEHQDVSGKQDKLTAGENITISDDNVISASGGSSGKIQGYAIPEGTTELTSTTPISNIEYKLESDTVTSIADEAFYENTNITSISFPNVETIGEEAFYDCSKLVSVSLPNVETIGEEAFSECSRLVAVNLGTKLTTIGRNAFSSCESLTSITIPDSVTTIGDMAFKGCKSLVVTMESAVPCTIVAAASQMPYNGSFGGSGSYGDMVAQIRVPADSLATYQAADNWSSYASIMVGY